MWHRLADGSAAAQYTAQDKRAPRVSGRRTPLTVSQVRRPPSQSAAELAAAEPMLLRRFSAPMFPGNLCAAPSADEGVAHAHLLDQQKRFASGSTLPLCWPIPHRRGRNRGARRLSRPAGSARIRRRPPSGRLAAAGTCAIPMPWQVPEQHAMAMQGAPLGGPCSLRRSSSPGSSGPVSSAVKPGACEATRRWKFIQPPLLTTTISSCLATGCRAIWLTLAKLACW